MNARSLHVLIPLLFAVPLQAQTEHEHHGAPIGKVGRVTLPTSCNSAAQPLFERGVALLHSFWYEEAARTFQAAAAADPACTMALWGLASSYLHPMWVPPTPAEWRDGSSAVERARALAAQSAREQGYLDAIAAYFADQSVPHPRRLRAWSDALGNLRERHPEDAEAATFYALSLVAVANSSPPDTTYALQRRAGEILEPLFQRRPDHPGLAHYLIHAYDAPALARQGSRAAERYASIAPSVPHARHMPSHIYIRLGDWNRAIASNTSSATAARDYERQQNLDGVWDQRLHAMDYLAYAYLQQGRDALARGVMDEAGTVTRTIPEGGIVAQYALAAIPARYQVERARWSEAARLPLRPGLQLPAEAATRRRRVRKWPRWPPSTTPWRGARCRCGPRWCTPSAWPRNHGSRWRAETPRRRSGWPRRPPSSKTAAKSIRRRRAPSCRRASCWVICCW